MSETPYPAEGGSSLLAQVANLAQSNLEVDDFLEQLFDKVSLAMEADGGSLWLYSLPDKKLACRLDRIPQEQAVGDLARDRVAQLVVKCMEEEKPALVDPSEGTPAVSTEDQPSLLSVPYTISEKLRACVLLYRWGPNRRSFRRDNVYICQSLSAYVSVYFANYNFRQSENRYQRLSRVVDIGREVASLLDPERIAYVIVNRALEVIQCDRAFIALLRSPEAKDRSKDVEVLAISRLDEIHRGSAQIQALKRLSSWAVTNAGDWYFTEEFMKSSDDEQLKSLLKDYFELTGMKGCIAVSLRHGDEVMGVLALESQQPHTYSAVDFALIGQLAKISASALRSASEHRALPALKLLETSLWLKRHLTRGKVLIWMMLLAAAVAAMVYVEVPFRVGGECEVAPVTRRYLNSALEAMVKEVLVKEGELVSLDDLVMQLDDRDIKAALDDAKHRLKVSELRMAALVREVAAYKIAEAENLRIQKEIEMLHRQLERTRIIAPITGTVMTPRIENLRNKEVQKGELLCEIADLNQLVLETAIPESLISYVEVGQPLNFVIHSFPGQTMESKVESMRLKSEPRQGGNVFVVTSPLDSNPHRYSPGMQGWTKVSVGKRPVGYVLFRRVIDYFRTRVF